MKGGLDRLGKTVAQNLRRRLAEAEAEAMQALARGQPDAGAFASAVARELDWVREAQASDAAQ